MPRYSVFSLATPRLRLCYFDQQGQSLRLRAPLDHTEQGEKMTPKLRTALASALASALAVCALGAVVPAAEADIYWGDYAGVGRSSLDGFDVNSSFVSGGTPGYVAVDSNSVYWTNLTANIGRASKDGSGSPAQNFITVDSGAYPWGITVDSGTIYWANYLANTIQTANASTGLGVQTLLSTSQTNPLGLTIDKDYVYWAGAGNGTIGRARRDGTDVNESFISGASGPYSVAVDDTYIYWVNYVDDTIGRARLDGTGAQQNFITLASQSDPEGIAVDANYIYWGNFGTHYIGRAKLDGTGADQEFINVGSGSPVGVAVDPSPSVAPVGKATKRSLKLKVGCGDGGYCSLRLTGSKVGTKRAIVPKTVTVNQAATVTLTYSAALRKALAKGGRISVTATNPATDAYRSIVVRVAR